MQDDFRVALVLNPALSAGLLANTAAAIGIGLGARLPDLAGTALSDRDGRRIDVSSRLAVPVLQVEPEAIRVLLLKALAREDAWALVAFPAFARSLHDFREYEALFPGRDLSSETIDGLGIAGPAKWVRSLTGSLKLLR
ncbi:DUF2000 domain-containing protein [Rhizobiaceae bacterium BDR2-2]|uniref:DUF2000 domain-containing protein n=1 Tax=Ectorhizobium quercum TaxID=2965071 RepID=A0AAE3N4Z4_9HYPH|nr:DUF2000 domain-containing protein [Ectorhizobium quercum]MCX8999987.1 DUF2000 domain-containing protein [Ectorhizobium quercum]